MDETTSVDTAAPVASETAAPVPAAPAAIAPASAAPEAKPASLHEAMFGKESAEQVETNRGKGPRQPDGKFTTKVSTDPVLDKPKPAAAPVASVAAAPVAPPVVPPVVKPAEVDPDAMPEGLTAKAQQRFQALANEVKELRAQAAPVADLTEKLDQATRQVEYVKTAFHQHGVKPEQFEQATAVIGMLNRGDYESARKALETQLQQIELITGKAGGQIDALANFPDLQQAVENLQVTRDMALEIARGRAQTYATQQQRQRDEVTQQQTQQTQEAVNRGTQAVDAFCKRMQTSDLDYSAIEAQLLPEVPNLLKGVPPQHWAASVEAHYRLIKGAASKFRQPSTPAGNPLRPTGQGSPGQAPKTAYEAMWGA